MSDAEEGNLNERDETDAFNGDCIEEIEIEDLTVDGICGVY